MGLIDLKEVRKTYYVGGGDVEVLRGITLSIEKGEFVALMGSSGSGKSTLMNILGCLDRPTSGQYFLSRRDVSLADSDERAHIRNRDLGFVFQSFNLLARTSALENVMMPLNYAVPKPDLKKSRAFAISILEQMGLGDRLDHHPAQLSGGQQQRVAISRALVNRPPLLLADEPTGNLDSKTSNEVLDLLRQLNSSQDLTIVMVTHDSEVAEKADRTIRLHDGVVV